MDICSNRSVERPRVLLADDNQAVLDTVKRLLEDEFEVIAAIQDPRAIVLQVSEVNPDIVVLDISMGEMSGFDITRELRSRSCQSRIIILSIHEELDFIRAALDAGACGYVFKSRLNNDLHKAITAALNNKAFIPDAPITQYAMDNIHT